MVKGKVGVKFCGGCNPQINRSRILKHIKDGLPEYAGTIPADAEEPWDVGIMMCACPVACVDVPEVRKNAKDWIVISGAMVDRFAVDESEIPGLVINKCNQLLVSESD